jgi:hypothetical protein
MGQFLTATGEFQSGRFAVWAALRPWQWARIAALARNSKRATKSLCDWVQKDLASPWYPKEIVTLDTAELSEVKH